MKQLKVSIAAMAFILTVGVSYATQATSASAPNDCSLTPNSPTGTLDSDNDCPGDGRFCCYLINSEIEVEKD